MRSKENRRTEVAWGEAGKAGADWTRMERAGAELSREERAGP